MIRLFKKYLIFCLIFLAVNIFSFGLAEAFSLGFSPLDFFHKTADIIINRVSDTINYLIIQKKYIFDHYIVPNNSVIPTIPSDINKITSVSVITPVSQVISYTSPLITEPDLNSNFILSNNDNLEILKYTNLEREKISVSPLKANATLNNIASLRVDDLFTNQYFEHNSPDGQSASDLAKKLGYNYFLIGENLALGNFNGDEEIVTAWMESPGHKANILNEKYKELGVAVKEGIYKGEKSTIAVQIFALPLSECPPPNPGIKTLIDDSSVSILQKQKEAKVMFDNLESFKNTAGADQISLNQKIQEYNSFAKQINDSVFNLKVIIDSYNIEVSKYNLCVRNI